MMEEQLGLFDQFEDNVEDDIFSKMTIEGDPPITFRYGVVGEEEIIQDIAKEFMKELGWVRPSSSKALDKEQMVYCSRGRR